MRRTIELWKKTLDQFPNEISTFSNFPTMYAGLVGPDGSLRLYDGNLRFVSPEGRMVADQVRPEDYATHIGEAAMADSYLKAPYYKPIGYPRGIYRVGPLARLNAADGCGTPEADKELEECGACVPAGSLATHEAPGRSRLVVPRGRIARRLVWAAPTSLWS